VETQSNNGNGPLLETALQHICTRVPVVRPEQTLAEVRQQLLGNSYDCASHLVVCTGEHFLGVLRIEDLLAGPDTALAGERMDADAPRVRPGIDQEIAAWEVVRHGEAALSVVDGEGRFRGLIPPERLLEVLLREHDEDLARVGGFLKRSQAVQLSSEEPLWRRFWHRLPWLLLGLAGALFAADLVSVFDRQLQANLLLAFFIPGIVYMADAVGTQTETLVVRGLSVGIGVRRLLRLELLSGLGIGLALGTFGALLVLWRWGDPDVALVLGLAILAACSTATLVAMALPWLLDRCGIDPAFGSGPLATVIQDLLSILIYFCIAAALMPG
jgi:magnesium transporter